MLSIAGIWREAESAFVPFTKGEKKLAEDYADIIAEKHGGPPAMVLWSVIVCMERLVLAEKPISSESLGNELKSLYPEVVIPEGSNTGAAWSRARIATPEGGK